MVSKKLNAIIVLLSLIVLISCVGTPITRFEFSVEGATQNDLISLRFDDTFSKAYNSGVGLSLFIPKELIDDFDFNLDTKSQHNTMFYWDFRIYDVAGNLVKADAAGQSLNLNGELDYKSNSFLWHICDINKSGLYVLTAHMEYRDHQKQQTLGIYSAPLYFDISVRDDYTLLEVTAEELKEGGVAYRLSGDTFADSIYGYTLFSDDTSRYQYRGFVYLTEDGGLIQGGSHLGDYYAIQRFYNIELEEDAARFVMTLPRTLPIIIVEDKDENSPFSSEKEPFEYAYLEVFKQYYNPEWINSNTREKNYRISVDLNGVLYEQPELIQAQIEQYLKGTGIELLWEDMGNLIEKGYVIADGSGFPMYFDNGSLFSFKDKTLTDTLFETDATMWLGNTGAYGAFYKLQLRGGKWAITYKTLGWVS